VLGEICFIKLLKLLADVSSAMRAGLITRFAPKVSYADYFDLIMINEEACPEGPRACPIIGETISEAFPDAFPRWCRVLDTAPSWRN